MLIHIKNENETAAIDTLGAELVSFMGDDGFEHIWQGDKTYWGGHAPVLFPIVGALRDNRTCINGEWYEMKRHGVARHEEFTVTEQGEDYVTLQLTANEETKKQYPFDFVLTVSYYLTGSSITTKFTVKNADTKPMPFCIGGHPGFNIPIQSDEIFEDYDIVFEEKEEQKCPTLDMESCLIDFEKTNFELDDTDTIPLQHSLFYKDALVFENLNSTCVSLKSRQSGLQSAHAVLLFKHVVLLYGGGAAGPRLQRNIRAVVCGRPDTKHREAGKLHHHTAAGLAAFE